MDGVNLFTQFVAQHKPQLESSGVPQHFWQSLHRKLVKETFDAGIFLQLLLIDYEGDDQENTLETGAVGDTNNKTLLVAEEPRPRFALSVACEEGIKAKDPDAIYLIDHAWTYRVNYARQQLEQHEQLTDRMCAIMGVDIDDEDRIDQILVKMWRYCHSYTIATNGLSDEERLPIWYVMDEVGSAITHSDDPNFRLVPFLYLNTQTTYSLLFPIRDCDYEEQVTRDFVEYVSKHTADRDALLLPWRATDLREHSFVQVEPDAEYFSSGHIPESYPEGDIATLEPRVNRNQPLKVYSEYDVVSMHLTDSCFQLVANESEADVLWLTHHYKNFAELAHNTPNKFINQFPYEYVLTIKDLLAITGRRTAKQHHNPDTLETYPRWLPTTFNLKTELLQFASYYQHRVAKGLDNHWIVKPWNLARGLDTHISDSIVQIVRLPITGPKVAQKYIERPVLFRRSELDAEVKFDIRYVILVKSFQPLEAYVHRKFFLRFANKSFSLNNYDDYEQHFTVMNYHEEAELRHIKCEDFLSHWKEQYPAYDWPIIEREICMMLHEVLSCATKKSPPCGIPPCQQSRALYAADIMLSWERSNGNERDRMQPKLLEINWTPDCKRACDYYPDFFNDIFKLLFLGEQNNESFLQLEGNT
ncbi:tubulin--tyrosine ligase-like protein 12 [Ceratitis capitata]|uniref:tubulin--tyrosine ligase-like protein 12 n=1 Tax=Ceratitis capitata TaxID=7213 RepID=UPI000329A0BC|nr:tubulin--tyrosine ligase-like protein 12 [Ceratitis capitata]